MSLFTNDLTWNHHINNITNKANASLRFIKRNVKTNSIKTKELAYKTYVRPKVEYCRVVWEPWQKQQINQIEMIQRRAARYTLNQYSYHSSVSAMLQHLCWPTLQQRRDLASVTMLYKLQHQLVSISNLHYLVPPRDHKFIQPFSPTNYHLYSFFPRTIRLWNSLPNQLANSPDFGCFQVWCPIIPLLLIYYVVFILSKKMFIHKCIRYSNFSFPSMPSKKSSAH